MKKTLVLFILLNLGCNVQPEAQTNNKSITNFEYKNNNLNLGCESLLKNNASDYLICDSWKTKASDIENIKRMSRKYQKNFISTHNLMTPFELRLERVITTNDKVYIIYPNGFFIEFKNKLYYDDWVKGYREINQSYSCVKEECNRYFLWSFVDEKIIDDIEKNGQRFPTYFRKAYQNILETPLAYRLNSEKKFIFKNDKININGGICMYSESNNKQKECLYYIVDHSLYVYNKEYFEGQNLISIYSLKDNN